MSSDTGSRLCPACQTSNRPAARFCRGCGTALAPVPAAVAGPPSTDLVPRTAPTTPARVVPPPAVSPRTHRRRLLILAGIAAVLVIGGGVLYGVQTYGFDPAAPIRQWFAALQHRNVAEVRVSCGCTGSLVTASALAPSHYSPPTHVQISKPSYGQPDSDTRRPDQRTALFTVGYTIGGHRYGQTMRTDQPGGLWHAWQLDESTPGLLMIVSDSVHTVLFGGVRLATLSSQTAGADSMSDVTEVPPGSWSLALPSDPLWTMPATTVAVPGVSGEGAPDFGALIQKVKLHLGVRPSVTTEVNRQVHAALDHCVTSHALEPCPELDDEAYSGGFPTSPITWAITAYPTIAIRAATDESRETNGLSDSVPCVVVTTHTGKATATYGDGKDRTTDPATVSVGGGVTVSSSGKVTWIPPD